MERPINCHTRIAEWVKVHPFFWKQMLVGTLSFIIPGEKSLNTNSTKDFFINHYFHQQDPYVFDGSSDKYFNQLQPAINDINSFGNIIDLGCGKFKLLTFLKKNSFKYESYIGFDFACPEEAISEKEKTYRLDFRSEKCQYVTKNESTVFAINTFCYIKNIKDIYLLNKANKLIAKRLIVLEPWPGLFWDRHFDGIWPTYRKPDLLAKNLAEIGWHREGQYNYYLFKICGKYLIPMSYVATFKR
ncbi:MAG: hypothetical protein ABIK15_10685 [Pseudomonadota bacterium]